MLGPKLATQRLATQGQLSVKAERVEHLRFEIMGEEYKNSRANALPLKVCCCKTLRVIQIFQNQWGGSAAPLILVLYLVLY
jgi:hypothetical protein